MTSSFFITGTDTNVGKTIVSAWLCLKWRSAYWKPIQTGAIEGTDTDLVYDLTKGQGIDVIPSSYLFDAPLSPHLAAMKEGKHISLKTLTIPDKTPLLIEGAGGVLVPLTEKDLMIDLIQQMKLPTLVVARTSLGTINHTLLTLEALKARGVTVQGVILNGVENKETLQSIETYGGVPVIGHLPFLSEITRHTLLSIPLRGTIQSCP